MNQPAHGRPLFGELAIRAGWLGPEHVNWALAVQAERKKQGVHLYIGSILVNQQYITLAQALQIMRHQRVQVMVDPQTNYRYNVHNYDPRQQYRSPESPAMLQPLPQPDSLNVRGDIGLRQVQRAQPQPHPQAQAGGGWAADAAVGAQTVWEEETSDAVATAAPAGGSASGSASASGPGFTELPSNDARASGSEDYDWYGQTILDDGSLAEQLKQATAQASPAEAETLGDIDVADPVPLDDFEADAVAVEAGSHGVRAKPGTVAFLALPHGPAGDAVYRAITDMCAMKGIGTVRMDDVADTSTIWKGIERFISGSALVIADLSGEPRPAPHVGHEVKHALRQRKPTVVVSHTPGSTAAAVPAVGISPSQVVAYPAGDVQQLLQALEPALDKLLQANNLAG